MAYIYPLTNRPADWTTPYIALFSGIQAMRGLSRDKITSHDWKPKDEETQPLYHGTDPEFNMPSLAELTQSNDDFMYSGNSDLCF